MLDFWGDRKMRSKNGQNAIKMRAKSKHCGYLKLFPQSAETARKIVMSGRDSIASNTGRFAVAKCSKQLRVTDMIPDALSCGGVLLQWYALCCGVWDFKLFVTLLAKRITCAQLHYFRKIQNAVLILSQDTRERNAQKLLLRQIFLFRLLFISLSRSAL